MDDSNGIAPPSSTGGLSASSSAKRPGRDELKHTFGTDRLSSWRESSFEVELRVTYEEQEHMFMKIVEDYQSHRSTRLLVSQAMGLWDPSIPQIQIQKLNEILPEGELILAPCNEDGNIDMLVVTIHSEGEIFVLNHSLGLPPCRTTAELRSLLSSSREEVDRMFIRLAQCWASCTAELLQLELRNSLIHAMPSGKIYRKKCLYYLRLLSKKYDVLPPSFILNNIVLDGRHPIWGGAFADVWKGYMHRQVVCLKVLRYFTTRDMRDKLIKQLCREALVWRQLRHPNVLPFLGVSLELFAPSFCLISPWMANGSLIVFLEKNPGFDRLKALLEVAEAMLYLHEYAPPVVHGDIRGANILVTNDLRCCLADFGLTTVAETQTLDNSSINHYGTVRWMAPELLMSHMTPADDDSKKPNSCARDIYAFGCTILEICTGRPPFHDYPHEIMVPTAVVAGQRPLRPPEIPSDNLWSLVEKCWAQDPLQRPSAQEIVSSLNYMTFPLSRLDKHSRITPTPGSIQRRVSFSQIEHVQLVDLTSDPHRLSEQCLALPPLNILNKESDTDQEEMIYAACNAAMEAGHLETAVELLSKARATFWTTLSNLRTPLDNLETISPQLTDSLRAVSKALEHAAFCGASETAFFRQRELNDEWNALVMQIRKLPGFGDFLRPKDCKMLQKAATGGPIAILCATKLRCDALVITLAGVKLVPLRDLKLSSIKTLQKLIQIALTSNAIWRIHSLLESPESLLKQLQRQDCSLDEYDPDYVELAPEDLFRFVLEELWKKVVLPVISTVCPTKSRVPPRLWWCPTGPLAFLPVHAAGIYTIDGEEIDSIDNYAISSYTTTLEALLKPPPLPDPDFQVLAVAQSHLPGCPALRLPFTKVELDVLDDYIPSKHLVKLGVDGSTTASVHAVHSRLRAASFVHFACHGIQNSTNPMESALLLDDGQLKLHEILRTPLPNAQLAFLSACETAKGDAQLPDEALHFAASMLFAGFHGVVGTIWPIHDDDAVEVTRVFYRHLFRNISEAPPDVTEAAHALQLD